MRDSIGIVLTSVGSLFCFVIPLAYWTPRQSAGLLSLILVVLAGLGLCGASTLFLDRTSSADWANLFLWFTSGGLIAIAVLSVMTISPYVGGVAILFLIAAVLGVPASSHGYMLNICVLLASGLICFTLLLVYVTRTGVEWVDLPESSSAPNYLTSVDYTDSFRVRLAQGESYEIETVAQAFLNSMSPDWVRSRLEDGEQRSFEPGPLAGNWQAFEKTNHEVVVGMDRSYINLRISIIIDYEDDRQLITATTVAQYCNWTGALYFMPVRYGHQIVLADTMRRMKARLEAS